MKFHMHLLGTVKVSFCTDVHRNILLGLVVVVVYLSLLSFSNKF